MPRLAYFDCPSGASGDMILGALVDAGVALDDLRAALRTLPLGDWEIEAHEVRRGAFRATKVDVLVDHGAHHHHRGLGDVIAILRGGALEADARERAERVFTRLAEAEARAHGSARDEVHFHDVGAVDAIVDVAGAVVGLGLLGVDGVAASALPLGGGLVDGPHGRIPVPAPGTAELLRGVPVVDTGVQAELVTPTGAAILTTLAGSFGRMPAMTVAAVGYGAGTRDLPGTPNILRCFVGEVTAPGPAPLAAGAVEVESVSKVETTIDDMSPQLYEPLMERLFAAGALDVTLTPVIMKRGRPGTVVTALAEPGAVPGLARVLFEESTSIGVRWSTWERARLQRDVLTLPTPHGPVRFKVSRLDGRPITVTPEFADVLRIARAGGHPVREVLEAARATGRAAIRGTP